MRSFVVQTAEDLQTAWLIPDAHHYHSLIDPAAYVVSCLYTQFLFALFAS